MLKTAKTGVNRHIKITNLPMCETIDVISWVRRKYCVKLVKKSYSLKTSIAHLMSRISGSEKSSAMALSSRFIPKHKIATIDVNRLPPIWLPKFVADRFGNWSSLARIFGLFSVSLFYIFYIRKKAFAVNSCCIMIKYNLKNSASCSQNII